MGAETSTRADAHFDRNRLVLDATMPFDRWAELGGTLAQVRGAVQWWIGDWCNHGERAYGDKYAQALDVTGLDYNTLATYAWVASRIEPLRRRETLSWSAHREVAGLNRAEMEQLTSRDLRALKAPDALETITLKVPRSVVAAWRRRAGTEPLTDVAIELLHRWADNA
jgi:hypothetical protein